MIIITVPPVVDFVSIAAHRTFMSLSGLWVEPSIVPLWVQIVAFRVKFARLFQMILGGDSCTYMSTTFSGL
jgi:hypothetical protein